MRGSIGWMLDVLSDVGINWVDMDVMSDAGVNWADMGVMSEQGLTG